ncbi:hypothetical protein PN499_27370 [Kamptonema animale CS-326]|jgi:hypothetical protein|uniref:hypothetical protein n=1 Tax=Kamptonema animale TaxID=92934 RepID=UPI00232B97DE|nr:hypothetical protein [Kamptonema animale]MDB9514925.1 hypothetical protein [Kamptonema animale CS-326]
MQPLAQFLTAAECAEVDIALLSAKEKFSTRLAIYALRVLKQIAEETGLTVEAVTNQQVADWIEKDENIKQEIEVDASFKSFFTNLVISSLRPLKQISLETGESMDNLTVKQVVAWFEKDGKIRREQGIDAAFLKL